MTGNVEQPESGNRGGGETILLVDDNENIRRLASRLLRELGYNLLEARDGVEALVLAEEAPSEVALVVTDVVMPQMTGPELARRLSVRFPRIKVLFMSGYAGNELDRYGIPPESTNLIEKPFRLASFAGKVRELLNPTDDEEGPRGR